MNILFIIKNLTIGGVEIVTYTLAKKFKDEGHNSYICSFNPPAKDVISERFNSNIDFYTLDGFQASSKNIEALRRLLIEKKIDFVVNQWGIHIVPIKTIKKASKGLNIKIITVYHNNPVSNGRTQPLIQRLSITKNLIIRTSLKLKKAIYEFATSKSMAYNYKESDMYLVLSPSFVDIFKNYTKIKDDSKLGVQTNPITIDNDNFKFNPEKKLKEIVFVGRIDKVQKRVDRIVEVWRLLENKFPDWKLTIVGDGEEKENLEKLSFEYNLKNIKFVGFQDPKEYYKRASILVLTSDFEGFPLVIAEAMSYGIVPCVYGSYPAVYDIIESKKDGIIVEKENSQFSPQKMADELSNLMINPRLSELATNAIEKSKHFSIDMIYNQWMNLFSKLN